MNVLLTGASRGIGAEIRKLLSAKGHRVIGMARTETHPDIISVDFSQSVSYGDVYCKATMKLNEGIPGFGQNFDVLINNAGICDPLSIEDTDLSQWQAAWERMFRINLLPAVSLTRIFITNTVERRRAGSQLAGRVINICSRVAFKGQADAPHYAASKAALLNFTRSMAVCYAAQDIGFYTVSPSWVETEMAHGSLEQMTWDIPTKKIATSAEVAKATLFFVEEATIQMTGANFDINGASYVH